MTAWFLFLVVISGSGPPSVTIIDFKDEASCKATALKVAVAVRPHMRVTTTICIQRF